MTLKRIVMHWTAGSHRVSDYDREHYHGLVDGEGGKVYGKLKPEANISTSDGSYVAHSRRFNTGAIGVAVAAMAGAKERPFDAGRYPITKAQLEAFVDMVADYAETYGIPITRKTVLTHAEIEPTHGVKQRGKWDITWLPGMAKPGGPIEVGDRLRAMISARMTAPAAPATPPEQRGGLIAAILSIIAAIFGGRK